MCIRDRSWEPTPAPPCTDPICDAAGQEGRASSSLPSRPLARAIAASGHQGTPASLAVTPGGRIASKRVRSWSPSRRVSRIEKGLKCPAALLCEPASKPGAKGWAPGGGQGPPPGPETISKLEPAGTGGPPDQGAIVARTWWVPQPGGVIS